MEAYLHTNDIPQKLAMRILKTANEFYGGSWAGILEVDLELDAWTASWWYNPGENDRTEKLLAETAGQNEGGRHHHRRHDV